MIITTTTHALIKVVKRIRPVIKKNKNLPPILACTLLEASNGVITLSGTTLQYALCIPLEDAVASTDGKCAIPFDTLSAIVESLPLKQVVTLSIDKLKMSIESGNYKGNLTLLDANDYPIISNTPPPPIAAKKEKQAKTVLSGVLKAYSFEILYGRKLESSNTEVRCGWVNGELREILGVERVCSFEMEADDLTPIVASLESSWHTLVQPICAYEVGAIKKQYMQVPLEHGSWRQSKAKKWQVVEEFKQDYKTVQATCNAN